MKRQRLTPMLAAAALSAAVLSACSATTVLNTLEPRFGVRSTRDVAYGSGPRQTLDLYVPRKSARPSPVVMFIYGGGWDSGKSSEYAFVGRALASHGYLAVLPNYRIYPDARYPDFLVDCAKAVRWTRDHAAEYGGDANGIFLIGHSAGAYNAAMLALDKRWLEGVGLDPEKDLKGVVGLAGPYDFLPLKADELKTIFGPEGQKPDSQPINHVTGREPPMFLAHDLGDTVVFPSNTEHLSARLTARGGQVEVRYYKGLSHALMIGVFAAPLRLLGPVFADVCAFIDQRSAAPTPRIS